MFTQEIINEIDQTLDQLIENAKVIESVSMDELSEEELAGFEKTQESLLHRFLRMDQAYANKLVSKRVEGKKKVFNQMRASYSRKIAKTRARTLSRKRGKKQMISSSSSL